jgi:hypothetical protein
MPSSDAGAPASDKPDSEQQRQKMVYSHALELISQPDTILKHFSRARDRCLNDAQLDCILLGGNANAGDARAHLAPSAQLVVMLPHNQVPGFKRGLMAALPGMEADITLRSEKIDADNVTQQIVDIDQRAKQLTLYRDSLMAIARQPNITVTELTDLQNKIAEAQTQIDALATEKTGIMDRVRRERVTMQFAVDAGVSDAARPIAEAWDTSFELFGRSASTLLQLLVVLLPWLVSGAFVWLIVRLVRGRKRAAPAAATRGAGGPPMMAPA